jgi:hypothetical protein
MGKSDAFDRAIACFSPAYADWFFTAAKKRH